MVTWQTIRPDEESSLPVRLPEDKGGRQQAQEDNEENAGEAVSRSFISRARVGPCPCYLKPCVLSMCLSFWGIFHTLLYWQLALLPMLLRWSI